MKLTSLSLRGVTRFAETVSIRFDDLGPGLIALVGENGAGKTSVMESVAASLHKTFPTRPGSIYDYCHGRDAFIETKFEDAGREITVRLSIDADRRTTEGFVFIDGEPASRGKAADFEDAVARLFGSRELFLASVFAAQSKTGSFLEMRRGDRKGLFVELLALGALEIHAQAARDRRAAAEVQLTVTRAKAHALEQEVARLDVAEGERLDALKVRDGAEQSRGAALLAEEASAAALAEARDAAARVDAAVAESAAADREAQAAIRRVADLKAERERIHAATVQRLRFLDPSRVDSTERAASDFHTQEVLALERRRKALAAELERAPDFDAARRDLADTEAQLAELAEQERGRAALAADLRQAAAELSGAERALEQGTVSLRQRTTDLKRRAGLLSSAPCTASVTWDGEKPGQSGAVLSDYCPLLKDAREAAAAAAVVDEQAELRPLTVAVAEHAERHAGIKRALEALGTSGPVAAVEQRVTELRRLLAIEPALAAKRAQLDAIDGEVRRSDEAWALAKQTAADERARLEAETVAAIADRDEQLARIDEDALIADTDVTRTSHAAALAQQRLDALSGVPAVQEAHARWDAARAARVAADAALSEALQRVAALTARVEALAGKRDELERARQGAAAQEAELSDWGVLSEALGQNGVQALEIDAAGPEVARLTNDLLEHCYGPRFAISFETLRQKRDGGYSEAFDVLVYDHGIARPVEALSGGERVVIGEAVSLALAIYNARKSGVRWETLFRDETAGALDPENASRYVAMLRRALTLGGFVQCIYVAHLPAVYEAADVQLYVGGGRVTARREAA